MTDAIRTPDVLLDGLPGFDWAPSFRQWDGLRLAHVDVGDGAPVLMLHGEPTWSYLWRKVAPPVLEAGHRVILPDLPGFGRSDKPMDEDWYSYDRHTAAIADLLEDARPARRHVRPARLGRPDRPAAGGRAARARGAARADGHRHLHRRAGDERGLAPLRGLRRPRRRAAGRLPRAPRLRDRPGRRGRRRLRRAVPERGEQGRRARLPGAPARSARPIRARRRAARCSTRCRATRGRRCCCGAPRTARCRPSAGEAFASELGRPAPRLIEGAGHFLQEDRGAADRRDHRRLAGDLKRP